MAYCAPRGIPLSVFLCWSEDDQHAALGWQTHEARRCASCGTHPEEWDERQGGDRHAYHGEHYQCPGCRTLDRVRQAPEIVNGEPGMHVRLVPGIHRDCPRCNPAP